MGPFGYCGARASSCKRLPQGNATDTFFLTPGSLKYTSTPEESYVGPLCKVSGYYKYHSGGL